MASMRMLGGGYNEPTYYQALSKFLDAWYLGRQMKGFQSEADQNDAIRYVNDNKNYVRANCPYW